MISKASREIAEASGNLKKIIGTDISDELSKTVTLDEQMAIAMNALEVIFDALEKSLGVKLRPEDFSKYEKLREFTKQKIYEEYK